MPIDPSQRPAPLSYHHNVQQATPLSHAHHILKNTLRSKNIQIQNMMSQFSVQCI